MRLVSRITRGYGEWADREDIPYIPIYRMTDSIIHRIKQARKSLIFPNASANQTAQDNVRTDVIGNWLVVPIIASDKLIGWVEIGKAGSELFGPEQGQWAEALVGPAAVAIQNAWLFDQLRSSSEMLHSLAHKLRRCPGKRALFHRPRAPRRSGTVAIFLKIQPESIWSKIKTAHNT